MSGKGKGRPERRGKSPIFWIILNQNGDTSQSGYVAHKTIADAVQEARRLATEFQGNKFFIMESIGGFVKTAVSDVEAVEVYDAGD